MKFRTPWGHEKEIDLDRLIALMREENISTSRALERLGGGSRWGWAVPDGPLLARGPHLCVGRGANVVAINNVNRFHAIAHAVAHHGMTWDEAEARLEEQERSERDRNRRFTAWFRSPEGFAAYFARKKRESPTVSYISVAFVTDLNDPSHTPWKEWYAAELRARPFYSLAGHVDADVVDALAREYASK